MSKLETPITEGFWRSVTQGTYMPEYPLVQKSHDRGIRLADAVILPDGPFERVVGRAQYHPLTGRHVIVVQTKVDRMGMYLMGQAVFSAQLALRAGAASVRSVMLCRHPDAALLPLLEPYSDVEVWLFDPHDPGNYRRAAGTQQGHAAARDGIRLPA